MAVEEKSFNVDEWVDRHQEDFLQEVDEAELKKLVGKEIRCESSFRLKNGFVKHLGFEALIVGYSKDVIYPFPEGKPAYKYSFLTDEGMSFAILKNTKWEVLK